MLKLSNKRERKYRHRKESCKSYRKLYSEMPCAYFILAPLTNRRAPTKVKRCRGAAQQRLSQLIYFQYLDLVRFFSALVRSITRWNWTDGMCLSPAEVQTILHFHTNCLATRDQGLPKSGFSSVGKLNFRDILAGKKRTSLFTKHTPKLTHRAMQS